MEVYKMKFWNCGRLNKCFYKNEIIYNHKLKTKNISFIIKSLIEINLIILFLNSLTRGIQIKNKNYFFENKNLLKFNIFDNKTNLNYFSIFDFKYLYSFKYNIIKIEYKIGFFDKNNNIILPSDLIINQNNRLICYINILYNNNNQIINSLPNIYINKYFKCIEFFLINEKVKIGIKLYEINEKKQSKEKFNMILIDKFLFENKNLFYQNNTLFDPLILNQDYNHIINQFSNKLVNDTLRLKKSYIRYPLTISKRNVLINENKWKFVNIYNNYFCFCSGLYCFEVEISQKSKYFFYLTIIDNNRNIYNKTDYLFIDFIFTELSSDDAFPIFKEMVNKNFPVHYLTENQDIYNEFCFDKKDCSTIILVNKENYKINGDFIERYLTLFLKLKQVISGGGTYFDYINNLFYNIEYITYISVTHGVCYFKYFLYFENNCYGKKRIDKILIPPLDILISLAKKYGWKDENIIPMNLPKWDKYIIINKTLSNIDEIYENQYILLLFTWRDINKNKRISNYYFKNIINLIRNNLLIKALQNKNITLYYTFHHKINNFNFYNLYKKENLFIKPINEKNISNYLNKASLVITDFSSIIFDLIYRQKPFVIYIPDSKDESNKDNYKYNYYELIELLKNDTIKFYNKYFELNEAIDKIIYYIDNNFQLESNLLKFYDILGFKHDNNINKFISYIQNLN